MDITCVIKTFERPEVCQRAVDSIRSRYPDIPILVADDSEKPSDYEGVTKTFHMPFDSGLSAGRNLLVRNVKTKYFVLLDDDWIFIDDPNNGKHFGTDLERFLKIFESSDLDILGGIVKGENGRSHFYGTIEKNGPVLNTTMKRIDKGKPFTRCDFTHNFFIAKTEVILKYLWDEELKLNEHMEFFLRLKVDGKGSVKVGFTWDVHVLEKRIKSEKYKKFRKRNFFKLAMRKHGIKIFHNHHGNTLHFD